VSCVGACIDYHPGALEADGQRLPDASCGKGNEARWHLSGGNRSISRRFAPERRDIGRAEKFGQVGRVDRRRFDANNNLVRTGSLDLSFIEAQTELTVKA
jgi:hypothetical protein